MHHVVIIGGGFGGLYASQALRRAPVEVTLVDRRNFHLFQPLLYQVATGSLSPGEIAAPLRALLARQKNARVLLGEAVDLDAHRRNLILSGGESVPYETLIVAAGARNYYFNHPEWSAEAPGLKSIEDATAIRSKILYAFEAAERETDPGIRRAWLTFVIVGAGPTGVELAGALAEIAQDTLRGDFRSIHPEDAHIVLVEGSPRPLPTFPEPLSIAAERSLVHLGVRPRDGVKVTAMDSAGVTIDTGSGQEHIAARTIIWAAGVTTSDFVHVLAHRASARLDRHERVIVEPDLSLAGHPEILVIGDMAYFEQNGSPLPGVAPVAMQQGRYAAELIASRLRGGNPGRFHYRNKGNLAVIGRAAGVADFGRLQFHGFLAWLLWLFVHLMYLAQFRNRLLVFIRWGFQYLTFDRGSRIITAPKE